MSSDIKFEDGDVIRVEARTLEIKAPDLVLDYSPNRKGKAGYRRALVHDSTDALVLNFNGDYPAGVVVHGPQGVAVHGRLHVGLVKAVAKAGTDWTKVPGGPPEGAPKYELGLGEQFSDNVFAELQHPAPLDVQSELDILRH